MIKYKIQKGDTLTAIALKYRTTVNAIKNANLSLITNVNNIKVGWVINIPISSEGSETGSERYEQIGKAFETCIKDIKNLASYKNLLKLVK